MATEEIAAVSRLLLSPCIFFLLYSLRFHLSASFLDYSWPHDSVHRLIRRSHSADLVALKEEKAPASVFGDAIDTNTFDQILEMDDPDDHEFSHSIVCGFFTQAEETFIKMDTAMYVISGPGTCHDWWGQLHVVGPTSP